MRIHLSKWVFEETEFVAQRRVLIEDRERQSGRETDWHRQTDADRHRQTETDKEADRDRQATGQRGPETDRRRDELTQRHSEAESPPLERRPV